MPKLLRIKKLCFRKRVEKHPKKFFDLLNLEGNKGEQKPYKYLTFNALRGLTTS